LALLNKENSDHDKPKKMAMNEHISEYVAVDKLFRHKILRLSVVPAILGLIKKWERNRKGLRRRA